MLISTRGRYALRMLIALSKTETEVNGGVPLRKLSENTGISMKYLESIISPLLKAGIVQARRGKSGGYRLARSAEEISISEILQAAGEEIAPVSCLREDAPCERSAACPTLPLYRKLDSMILGYLDSISLGALISGEF
jgi:Rrf2 family protein